MATEKKTRKRSPEEQALWDSIEEMKKERRTRVSTREKDINTLSALRNTDDLTLAGMARAIIAGGDAVEELTRQLVEAEDHYKKMRTGE